MKRLLIALALICATGCLQQCQAVGHGAIGGGAVGEGVIGGGAVGGRHGGATCTPPGSPALHYSAHKQASTVNGARVATVTDHGSMGEDADREAADYGVIYFNSCGTEGSPCFHFDGNESLTTGAFAGGDLAQPVVWGFIARPDSAAATRYVFDGHNSSTKRQTAYQNTGPNEWELYAGGVPAISTGVTPSTTALTRVVWDVDGASSEALVDGVTTGTVNSGAYPLDGLTIGARFNSANKWFGDIAEIVAWTDSSYGTLADVDEYLECVETINNGANPDACVALLNSPYCPDDRFCKIAIVGDSIMLRPSASVDDLETNLEARIGSCATIDSFAVSGQSCDASVTAYETNVLGNSYDLVINNCGINDISGGDSAASTLADREDIATQANGDGSIVLDLALLPWKNFTSWTAGKQTETDSLNTSLSTPVNSTTFYVDTYTLMEDPSGADELLPAYDSGDGLHQNSAGTDALADYVYDFLVGAL